MFKLHNKTPDFEKNAATDFKQIKLLFCLFFSFILTTTALANTESQKQNLYLQVGQVDQSILLNSDTLTQSRSQANASVRDLITTNQQKKQQFSQYLQTVYQQINALQESSSTPNTNSQKKSANTSTQSLPTNQPPQTANATTSEIVSKPSNESQPSEPPSTSVTSLTNDDENSSSNTKNKWNYGF